MFAETATLLTYLFLFIILYFEVFLLLTFLEEYPRVQKRRGRAAEKHLPTVTVIVPCYNEERTLARTVRSLLALDYPKDKLAIFVVNDGSTDKTPAIARRFEKYRNVRAFTKAQGGKYSALNLGLAHATTELVAGLDADSHVAPDALRELVAVFADSSVAAATPAIHVDTAVTVIQLVQKAEYAFAIFLRRVFGSINTLFVTPGPFSVFRRSVFAQLGPFREGHNTEDLEMCLRMQRAHYRITNVHTAHVRTNVPHTFGALVRQRVRWTYGYIQNLFDYRSMLFNPRYGVLGMLVLPITTVLIVAAIYFLAFALMHALNSALAYATRVATVGVSASLPTFHPFFFDTGAVILLTLTLGALAAVCIIIGKHISDTPRLGRDIVYYLLLYGLLSPLWLAKGVWSVARSKKGSWQREHDVR